MDQLQKSESVARKDEELTVTVREAAMILKVSPQTICRLIQRRKLKCIASIRHKRIPHEEIKRFLKEDLR